jgi:hypothetical protein
LAILDWNNARTKEFPNASLVTSTRAGGTANRTVSGRRRWGRGADKMDYWDTALLHPLFVASMHTRISRRCVKFVKRTGACVRAHKSDKGAMGQITRGLPEWLALDQNAKRIQFRSLLYESGYLRWSYGIYGRRNVQRINSASSPD